MDRETPEQTKRREDLEQQIETLRAEKRVLLAEYNRRHPDKPLKRRKRV